MLPFTAKCVRCGYVVMANKRKTLNVYMQEHDSKSHKDSTDDDYSTWIICVVSHRDYNMLLIASKSPKFWNAINTRLK